MLGFIFRDELRLRLFVGLGLACDLSFYMLHPAPALQSAVITIAMIAINAALIGVIAFERLPVGLTPAKKRLYREAFPRLSPGQFRRITRAAVWHQATEDTVLTEEGSPVRHLYFVQAKHFGIRKGGIEDLAQGPAFVGEIALLTGDPAAATVEVAEGTQYVAIPVTHLRRCMARSDSLDNAISSQFAESLALQTSASLALVQAPTPAPREKPTHVIDSPRLN